MWRSVVPNGWVHPCLHLEMSFGEAMFGHISESFAHKSLNVHTMETASSAFCYIVIYLRKLRLPQCRLCTMCSCCYIQGLIKHTKARCSEMIAFPCRCFLPSLPKRRFRVTIRQPPFSFDLLFAFHSLSSTSTSTYRPFYALRRRLAFLVCGVPKQPWRFSTRSTQVTPLVCTHYSIRGRSHPLTGACWVLTTPVGPKA